MGNMNEDVQKILRENKLCVLATASREGMPEAATIQYAEKGLILFFKTFSTYEKFGNLKQNPRAAIVITPPRDEQGKQITLQMKGNVEELVADAHEARTQLLEKHGYNEYFGAPNVRYFQFVPFWMKLLRDPNYPPIYEEMQTTDWSMLL